MFVLRVTTTSLVNHEMENIVESPIAITVADGYYTKSQETIRLGPTTTPESKFLVSGILGLTD